MWMMGYNNEDDEFSMVDHSFNGRNKLMPLMPRPMTSPINISTATTIPCLNLIHGSDFFSQYHHLDQSKREQFNVVPPPVVVSSRWNPTPEQLRALEELYRRGTRTPSAEQIQHITAQLRRFGKIEGKNVFYWFQNHKARERQKRRRQMVSPICLGDDHHHHDLDTTTPEKKELAACRTVFEANAQTKNLTPFTNCSSTLAEESVSIQRATEKAEIAVCKTHGWLQFEEGELQQRRNFMERNATWHVKQFSPPSAPAAATYLINTHASTTVTTRTTMDPMLIKTHDLSFFINTPPRKSGLIHLSSSNNSSNIEDYDSNNFVESNNQTTLQLFPLRSSDDDGISDDNNNMKDEETEISASAMNANLTPSLQFFEFLPMKN